MLSPNTHTRQRPPDAHRPADPRPATAHHEQQPQAQPELDPHGGDGGLHRVVFPHAQPPVHHAHQPRGAALRGGHHDVFGEAERHVRLDLQRSVQQPQQAEADPQHPPGGRLGCSFHRGCHGAARLTLTIPPPPPFSSLSLARSILRAWVGEQREDQPADNQQHGDHDECEDQHLRLRGEAVVEGGHDQAFVDPLAVGAHPAHSSALFDRAIGACLIAQLSSTVRSGPGSTVRPCSSSRSRSSSPAPADTARTARSSLRATPWPAARSSSPWRSSS